MRALFEHKMSVASEDYSYGALHLPNREKNDCFAVYIFNNYNSIWIFFHVEEIKYADDVL